MSNPLFLILRLEAPMQSWGLYTRYDFRNTNLEPTKSGLIGLLACALGYHHNDPQILELDLNLTLAIRVEREGDISLDYQTIKGSLNSKRKIRDETIVSKRKYIFDGSFLAIFAGNFELLTKCAQALQNPKWILYLGRKSCPPTRPPFEELSPKYSSLEEAIRYHPWQSSFPIPKTLKCIIEDPLGENLLQDRITNTPISRLYSFRNIRRFQVPIPKAKIL